MQRKFQVAFYVPGTLAADWSIKWTAPSPCTLVHVSAVGSNAYAAGLNIGESTDTDGYITKADIGVSGTPVEFEALTDFAGALADSQFPHLDDGDILTIELDYDYNGGGSANASADVCVVLTFVEG